MNNPTMENVLNLALDATPEERARSLNLEVGFDAEERTWEVIVKYSGSLKGLEDAGVSVTELLNGYAVLMVPESRIDQLARMPENRMYRRPKRLFFSVSQGKSSSLFLYYSGAERAVRPVWGRRAGGGAGFRRGLCPSGFQNEDGSTRILALWE